MKKYIVVIVLIFLFLIINFSESYSFVSCSYDVYPVEVTTDNVEDYLISNGFYDINEICFNDVCYYVREGNIKDMVSNYKKIFNDRVSEEDLLTLRVKGYPINKISLNECR